MTMNSKQLTQQPEDRHDDPKQRPADNNRRNPRLVFNDPDRFFRDLLMEQQEQK